MQLFYCFSKGRPSICYYSRLSQSLLLYYIKAQLGFGRVIKQGQRTFRFVVQDYHGLLQIIHLVNGNLVLTKKKRAFKSFIEAFNKYYTSNILFIDRQALPSLNDA